MSEPPGASEPARGAHPSGDERFALVDTALKRARFEQDQLIEILHTAQGVFGHLSEDLLHYVARALQLPPSRVHGVATFYHLFTFDPPGDHTCNVCTGTACFVRGSDEIVTAVSQHYGVSPGSTTPDGRFTLSTARCLGSCGLAPVVVLDGQVRGHVDAAATLEAIAENMADEDGDAGTSDTGTRDAGTSDAGARADQMVEVG